MIYNFDSAMEAVLNSLYSTVPDATDGEKIILLKETLAGCAEYHKFVEEDYDTEEDKLDVLELMYCFMVSCDA